MKRKMTIHDHVRIHTILFVLGVVIVVIGGFFSQPLQPHWLLWVGVIIFLSSFIYRVFAIKCPHCGSGLYSCRELPTYCPDCGEKLI